MELGFSSCSDLVVYRGRLGRGCSWSREETLLLLDIYEKQRNHPSSEDCSARNSPKYQKIHQAISGILNAHGFSRTPMQVRERLKRLKRDFRENRHGEFTERVGAILGRRLEIPAVPHDGGSPSQGICYPMTLVKTEMTCPTSDDMPEPQNPSSSQPVSEDSSFYEAPNQEENSQPSSSGKNAPSENSAICSNIKLQQRTVRLLSQLLSENRRRAQKAEAFQNQVLYQLQMIACSLQSLVSMRNTESYQSPGRLHEQGMSPSQVDQHEEILPSSNSNSNCVPNSTIKVKRRISEDESS